MSRLHLPRRTTLKPEPTDFDCYLLNVLPDDASGSIMVRRIATRSAYDAFLHLRLWPDNDASIRLTNRLIRGQ